MAKISHNKLLDDATRIEIAKSCKYKSLNSGRDLQQWLFSRHIKIASVVPDPRLEIASFALTVSYLHLLNSFQYYFSFIHLSKTSGYMLQSAVLRYYSIFFAMNGLLESQYRGFFTFSENFDPSGKQSAERGRMFLNEIAPNNFETTTIGGQQHSKVATWFFELLKQWTSLPTFSTIDQFSDDPTHFSQMRHWENYSTDLILEELYYSFNLGLDTENLNHPPEEGNIRKIFDESPTEYEEEAFPEDCWTIAFFRALSWVHRENIRSIGTNDVSLDGIKNLTNRFLQFHKGKSMATVAQHFVNYIWQ